MGFTHGTKTPSLRCAFESLEHYAEATAEVRKIVDAIIQAPVRRERVERQCAIA
ncbi:MAG: hypothetical protein WCA35_00915 [Kovacikia sp.]